MNWTDIKKRFARPRHDCQVMKERQTGRHRAEPEHRWGVALFILGTIGLAGMAIVVAFIAQGNPEPVTTVQPSYNPVPAPHVFPPVRQQPTPAASTYTVVAGDTMWSIAYKKCGNGLAWQKLQAINSNNPWWLHKGQKLKISC